MATETTEKDKQLQRLAPQDQFKATAMKRLQNNYRDIENKTNQTPVELNRETRQVIDDTDGNTNL